MIRKNDNVFTDTITLPCVWYVSCMSKWSFGSAFVFLHFSFSWSTAILSYEANRLPANLLLVFKLCTSL